MATGLRETGYTFDANLELMASETLTASDAQTIIDLGASQDFNGDMVVDISAMDIVSNDELYSFILEGSDSATFASGIEELARLHVGANEVLTGGGDTDSDTGRYVAPFNNKRNGRRYRYVRLNVIVAGTTPSVTVAAYIGKSKLRP